MSKWTPGPWRVEVYDKPGVVTCDFANRFGIYSDATKAMVVTRVTHGCDARLVAAAPEMAELLERMCARAKDEGWIEVRDARALLDKVDGK